MKKRFTEEQIVRILKEAVGGMAARDECRKHSVSEQTFYRWKAKSAGMQVSDVKRLKELEHENDRLKKIVAELTLDIRMLKDVNSKKMVSLPERRRAAEYLQKSFGVSERKACRVLSMHRSTHLANQATRPNQVWRWDFIHDQSLDGRSLRCLVVVDEFTRECLAIECGRSMTSQDVIGVLERLKKTRGAPEYIRSDNGPEFVARSLKNWMQSKAIGSRYIEPGGPWQNAYAESFNSIRRSTCLNRWAFDSVA